VLVAEHLGVTQPNFTSTAAALAPVVGVMAQHLLSIGAWGTSASNATLTMSYPVRWQLYGSGRDCRGSGRRRRCWWLYWWRWFLGSA